MTIYIKNMVCVRCKMAVQSVLEILGINYSSIELGKAELATELTVSQKKELITGLSHYKLELVENRKKILVHLIKSAIIEIFQSDSTKDVPARLSDYLSKTLFHEYTYMANIFSEMEKTTIEKFYILARIERVKELVAYESSSLKEITFRLNYSSVSHLCKQFKKITGHTPSEFKKLCMSEDYIWKTCE